MLRYQKQAFNVSLTQCKIFENSAQEDTLNLKNTVLWAQILTRRSEALHICCYNSFKNSQKSLLHILGC